MKELSKRSKFGELQEINEQEYKKEVTEVKGQHIVVFLFKPAYVCREL